MSSESPNQDRPEKEPRRRRPGWPRWHHFPTARMVGRRAKVGAKQVLRREVPGEARYAFRVDLIASLLAGLYTGAVFPFIGVIARGDLQASKSMLALITAAPFLGNLLALFWARAIEGRSKTQFVKTCHLGARFMVMGSAFAVGAVPFAFVMSACQVIGTIATPAYAAVMKDVYPDDQRGKLLGYTRAAILAAQIGSTLLAGVLLGLVGYRVVFPLAALIGVAAALVFSRINPNEVVEVESGGPRGSLWHSVKQTGAFVWDTLGILREDRAYRWFALSVFTYGFGNLLTVPIMPIIQVNELHLRTDQVAVLTIVTQVVAVGAYFYWGRYVDTHSPQRAVVINVLLNCLIPLVYISTAGVPAGGGFWALAPAYVAMGIVAAGIDMSYFNALLSFAGSDSVARYQALQSFLLGVRGTLAPFLGSFLADALEKRGQNLRWVFAVGLVFMLAGAVAQVVAMRRQEGRQRGRA
jgi:hypothetical protein